MVLAAVTIFDKLRQRSPTSSNPFTHLINFGIRTPDPTVLRTTSMWTTNLVTVMDMVIFRMIFFELLVFFTFTLLILHFAY